MKHTLLWDLETGEMFVGHQSGVVYLLGVSCNILAFAKRFKLIGWDNDMDSQVAISTSRHLSL
jgi:hypothetical protein